MNSHPENKQCNAVLHVALPTALRAADGSKGGLTNIYLGLNHPRWIGCMQMSTRGLWLAVCKWVRTGVRNCSGINNLAARPRRVILNQTRTTSARKLRVIVLSVGWRETPDSRKRILEYYNNFLQILMSCSLLLTLWRSIMIQFKLFFNHKKTALIVCRNGIPSALV